MKRFPSKQTFEKNTFVCFLPFYLPRAQFFQIKLIFSTPANQFLLLLLQFLFTGFLTPVSSILISSLQCHHLFSKMEMLVIFKIHTQKSLQQNQVQILYQTIHLFFFNRISTFPACFEILVANRLSKPFYSLDLCSLWPLLLCLSSFPCVFKCYLIF